MFCLIVPVFIATWATFHITPYPHLIFPLEYFTWNKLMNILFKKTIKTCRIYCVNNMLIKALA